jgi:GT2 family glycosyltransferase
MRILCIPVNYGSDADTNRFVEGLAATTAADRIEVLVVDNTERSEDDGFASAVERAFARARVLKPAANLGYFGAANWALREYLLDRQMPDWVVVSNVDIRIEDAAFFDGLNELQGCEAAVVGPAIWSDRVNRSTNPQYERRPSAAKMRWLAQIFGNMLTMNLYFLAAYAKYGLMRWRPAAPIVETAPRAVYSVHGSCLLFSRRYFESGGSLEYPCFLFGEEIFVAETARRLGLGVVYHPGMRVSHRDHATTGLFRTGKLARRHAESAAYLAREFFAD